MSPEKVIYTLLTGDAWLTSHAVRIWTQARPEPDPLPAIVISKISDVPVGRLNALAGANKHRARISCLCMGASAESAKSVAQAVEDACLFDTGTIGGVNVDRVRLDGYGPDSYDGTVEVYMQPIDLLVIYDR